MKILDRYIAKNFLFGYFIALFVMIGMFLTIDLFLNLDEFAEAYPEIGTRGVLMNIFDYYSVQSCLWYHHLAGMVIVVAAVFSLTRMTRNNELIAVMASGVSLKRILAPILFLSLLLTLLMVLDQEILIPKFSNELTRKHDDTPESLVYDIWFIGDDKASLFCSRRFEESTGTLHQPMIILRAPIDETSQTYRVTGRIEADLAIYNPTRSGWDLANGRLLKVMNSSDEAQLTAEQQASPVEFYETTLTAKDIPVRRREGFKSLLSLKQLTELEKNTGTRRTDLAELALQKHSRITDPIVNMIMLMLALPVLVCRDPRAMKTAILVSFSTTGACFLLVFLCKLFATEVFLGHVQPAFWTWAPIFIFFPIAIVQIDSMRT